MPEESSPEDMEKSGPKDITADIILSDEDIGGDSGGAGPEDRGDHPFVAVLDMAVSTGTDYCRKEGLPSPNTSVYEHFSKPFLNTAMWHYFPDGSVPDDPRIALALGVGGLALAFAPALMEIHRRRQEETEENEQEEKSDRKGRAEQREEYIPALDVETPKEGVESPVWVKRLTDSMIPGL